MAQGYLFFSDLLTGRTLPTELRTDPRYMFIETVQYRAPNQLQLMGGKTDRLPQMLARLGLGGTSA